MTISPVPGVQDAPYQDYTITEVISAAAQDEIIAKLTLLHDLIGKSAADGGFTDGSRIANETASQIRQELYFFQEAIDAAPTA